MNPLSWLDEELTALEALGLRRKLVERTGPQGAKIRIDGAELINFGSNDYLGLAADPRLSQAAIDGIGHQGWGAGASPLVTGRADLHAQLERRLAEFKGTEAALLFPTGFAANAGAIAALAGRGDVIFSDSKNHASIIDGCKLSGARVQVYPHGHAEYIEKMLSQAGGFRRRLIVTDSLFSMDGDFAPLVELADLAEKYDAMLLVDEAHATGVFGQHGRGVSELLGIQERVHVTVGTLSKALGSHGGFVAGSQALIDYLTNRARPYVFSTAAPAALCAAGIAALNIVRDEPHRQQTLAERAESLRRELRGQGWNLGDCQSQIVPAIVGDPETTMRLAGELRRRGMWVPGIRPPSVPEGESLLRISLSCEHTPAMIDLLSSALKELR